MRNRAGRASGSAKGPRRLGQGMRTAGRQSRRPLRCTGGRRFAKECGRAPKAMPRASGCAEQDAAGLGDGRDLRGEQVGAILRLIQGRRRSPQIFPRPAVQVGGGRPSQAIGGVVAPGRRMLPARACTVRAAPPRMPTAEPGRRRRPVPRHPASWPASPKHAGSGTPPLPASQSHGPRARAAAKVFSRRGKARRWAGSAQSAAARRAGRRCTQCCRPCSPPLHSRPRSE